MNFIAHFFFDDLERKNIAHSESNQWSQVRLRSMLFVNVKFKLIGFSSPQQRRRMKRSSIGSNALLSTVASVHELMSFVIYKGSKEFIQ